jgi:hypothetical protein
MVIKGPQAGTGASRQTCNIVVVRGYPLPGRHRSNLYPLNPGSVGVVTKLGMNYRNRMAFSLFISESELADDVAEYEIWRLANDSTQDTDSLVEQVAFRTGQLSRVTSLSAEQLLGLLSDSLLEHYRQKTTEKERTPVTGGNCPSG